MAADALEALREEMARRTRTQAQDWYPTFRARHAMQAVFETLREQRGQGEVITQLLTCCTAVDPIIAAGLAPRYADISPRSLAIDGSAMTISPKTRAVMLQHTFGLFDPDGDEELVRRTHEAGVVVLEDCAHCAGHFSRGADGHPLADVSFHSFGVQKMAATDFGSLTWVNPRMADAGLRQAIVEALAGLPVLSPRLERAARNYDLQIRVLMKLPAKLRHSLSDSLSARELYLPPVSSAERRGMVSLAPMRPSAWVCDHMQTGLADLDFQEKRSLEATRIFARELAPLAERGLLAIPAAALERERPLLRFPLVIEGEQRADALIEAIGAAQCYCDSWGRPALFPGVLDPSAYGLANTDDLSAWSETSRVVAGVVPLYTSVSPDEALTVSQVVKRFVSSS